jgi:hypothetical protein
VLTSIGGSLDCRGTDTKAAFPVLTSIGGYLDCSGKDTNAAFPVLTSIGGYLYCRGTDTKAAFPLNPKINDNNCMAKSFCTKALMAAFASVGILFADGISAKKISIRVSGDISIHTVVIVGKTKKSYVIERNGTYSHGNTITEARSSLIYKLSDRDTSIFKTWKLETIISLEDAILSYRVITGACEAGVRGFCEKKKLKKRYTVGEIIKLTSGAYGNNEYKQFFY